MLIHPLTQNAIDTYLNRPSHALLIAAPAGAGKFYVAKKIAAELLGVSTLDNYPYTLVIESSQMTIDAVRTVKVFLGKKTTGGNDIRRIVVLDKVDSLSDSGQNALLKSVEEPPNDTVIIMTTDDISYILPTILSRCTHMTILPVTHEQAALHYSNVSTPDLQKAFLMSKGYVGLMEYILHSKDEDIESAMTIARELLQGSTHNRICSVEALSKSKQSLSTIIKAVEVAIQLNFYKSISVENHQAARRFHVMLRSLGKAQQQLHSKTNTKLVLSNLFLQM